MGFRHNTRVDRHLELGKHKPESRVKPRSARAPSQLSDIVSAVVASANLPAAFDAMARALSASMNSRVSILQQTHRGWALVAQSQGGMRISLTDLHAALEGHQACGLVTAIDLHAIGEGVWTLLTLGEVKGAPVAILLAADWTGREGLEPMVTALWASLLAVQERQVRGRVERLLVDAYAMGRRLSRMGGLDLVAQGIVEQVSATLEADRVALALYRPEEDRLVIAATHGYPASLVKDVRIEPGEWVVGHVYETGRPIVVPDIRQMGRMPLERRPYRTFSFAAVPVLAGADKLGVLTATDKRDGSAFDKDDALALRVFGVSSALALVATKSDAERHRLAYAATVDSLTTLFNRPYFDTRLHEEFERARRGSTSLTVLMADVDDFKKINDTHGHQVGDAVLRLVGSILRSAVRVFDVCARYGGDEFAIVMPSSDQSSAAACAERIRLHVSAGEGDGAPESILPSLTMSIGVAVMRADDTPAELLRRADKCLYEAKAAGKNCIRVDGQWPSIQPLPRLNPGPKGTV
jgi:diguanylate cyclase (GGDEF)-like protein